MFQRGYFRTYVFEKKPWSFWICQFTVGNSRESKTSLLDVLQSCVAPIGNFKAKNQERWKLHMIFF